MGHTRKKSSGQRHGAMRTRLPVSALVLCLITSDVALGHVVWEYPTPRYAEHDRLKAHPCGTGGQLNDWDAPATTLQAGKQLLRFRETIIHTGAPARIALTIGNDDHYSEFVLLDHIPHNEGAPKVDGAVMHAVEVDIPPVDCSAQNCGLQLIQVMTDKFAQGESCANPSELVTSCGNPAFAYFSCANIKIEGGTDTDPAPIYRSWTVGGSANDREPYRPGETGAWCWDAEGDHWRLHGNGFSCPGMESGGDEEGSGVVQVRFNLDRLDGTESETGCFVMEIHPDWAPKGAARMQELLDANFFDQVRFFRVIPGFMAQFGISGDPQVSAHWRQKSIEDDPVLQSNTRSFVSFATAGPNTRTSQLFINFADNSFLDAQGFSPFAAVTAGMDVVDRVFPIGETPQQSRIQAEGNAYLEADFPQLTHIRSTDIIQWSGAGDPCQDAAGSGGGGGGAAAEHTVPTPTPDAAAAAAALDVSAFTAEFHLTAALGAYPDGPEKGAATLGSDSVVWLTAGEEGGYRVHYRLTGLPGEETRGRLEVHAGTACEAHELVLGNHFATAEDPWAAEWSKAAGATEAEGSVLAAETGVPLAENEGRAFVVREESGKGIACGVLQVGQPAGGAAEGGGGGGWGGADAAVLVLLGVVGVGVGVVMARRKQRYDGVHSTGFELPDRQLAAPSPAHSEERSSAGDDGEAWLQGQGLEQDEEEEEGREDPAPAQSKA